MLASTGSSGGQWQTGRRKARSTGSISRSSTRFSHALSDDKGMAARLGQIQSQGGQEESHQRIAMCRSLHCLSFFGVYSTSYLAFIPAVFLFTLFVGSCFALTVLVLLAGPSVS